MPIPTHEERLGTLLGNKYRLDRLIGRGGMGAVFAGVHTLTGRPVAVKVLHHEQVENADTAQRFLREARVVAGLKHPNVVDVLDLGEEPDRTVYMVLELLEGETFTRLLEREGPLRFERAAELLYPVMRALTWAHGRGVVHRDIKPDNLFLHRDAEGHIIPKVLDFGIAKALDEPGSTHVTQTGFVMGTPAYMSPEQAEGVPERIGAASDVWSMGVVWYEALVGELPFGGPTPTAILLAVNAGRFTRLTKRIPALPVPVANAIDKALVRDVPRRHPDMGAFLDALQRAAADVGREVPATPTPGAVRPSRDPLASSPPTAPAVTAWEAPAAPADAPFTLGPTTDLHTSATAAPTRASKLPLALALLVGAGLAAGALLLRSSPVPPPPTPVTATPIATPLDAATTPEAPTPEAPAPDAAAPPDASARAPTPSRTGRSHEHSATPLVVAAPTPAAPAPTPAAPAPTPAEPVHRDPPVERPAPRDAHPANPNAPMTEYDPGS